MTINIENEYTDILRGRKQTDDSNEEVSVDFLSDNEIEEISRNVILTSLEHENCPYEAEVSLVITGDEEIRVLNREHRNIDKSTDVLSFPMADFTAPADFSILEDETGEEYFNPDTGEFLLGDIVISADHCILQAKEYGHSVTREFAFLIVHSMLHLMGYDHLYPLQAKEMELHQEEILSSLNYLRN